MQRSFQELISHHLYVDPIGIESLFAEHQGGAAFEQVAALDLLLSVP